MADIVIDHLCKAFDGKTVLKDVSLRLPTGEVSCLMGPSGAGKTTLLRVLMGLETADSGSVTGLEGAKLGAVFQEDRLLDAMDAADNLRLVNPLITRREALDALGRLGLEGTEGQPAGTLSGGMRRRVALLRALLSDGQVLLLDEPFGGLDEATHALALGELERLRAGRTVLLVTHDPEDARRLGGRVFRLEAP